MSEYNALKRFSVAAAGLLLITTACAGNPAQPAPGSTPTTTLEEITPAVLPAAGAGAAPAGLASPAATASPGPTAGAASTNTPAPSPTPRPSDTASPPPAAPTRVPATQASGPTATPDAAHEAFFRSIAPYAQAEQADSGVPASFSLAMAASETGWGASPLMKQHNNYHGISCSKPNEGLPCVAYGDGMWNAYSSPLQGFLWAGRWLRGHREFDAAFQHTDDVEAFTRLTVTCYVSCGGPFQKAFYDGAMRLINQYNLRQYDAATSAK